MAACCRETVFLVSCILPRMRLLRSRSNALSLSLLLIPHRRRGEMREREGETGGRGLLLITLGFVTFSIIQQTLDKKKIHWLLELFAFIYLSISCRLLLHCAKVDLSLADREVFAHSARHVYSPQVVSIYQARISARDFHII